MGRGFKHACSSDHAVAIWNTRSPKHECPLDINITMTAIVRAVSCRDKRQSSASEVRLMLAARGIVVPKVYRKYKTKPVPSAEALGIKNTAGYFKAQVIRLAAKGLSAQEIWQTMSEFIQSPADIEKAMDKDWERIELAKSFSGHELEAYLNGVAVAHNEYLFNRSIRFKIAA